MPSSDVVALLTSAFMQTRIFAVEELRETTSFLTADILGGDAELLGASGFAVEAVLAPALSKYRNGCFRCLLMRLLLACQLTEPVHMLVGHLAAEK